MAHILVGATIPAFKMADDWDWWLINAPEIARTAGQAGHQVEWLAVLQTDARGDQPFAQLYDRMVQLSDAGVRVDAWAFQVDTDEDVITTPSRLAAICTGRNLIIERALRGGHSHIYFADSDIEAPDDVLVRLLELDRPVAGAHVPTYCLDGPPAWAFPGMDVREHWNTAGSLLIAREAFRRVPWRHDPDAGETDDPATQAELARLGWPTLVRHDVICHHHPDSIGGLEQRGHDLVVYR